MVVALAAASSIANGNRPRRSHSAATASPSISSNRARSPNRRAASRAARGSRSQTFSPRMTSGWRLVATIRRRSHRSSRAAASSAHESTTWSQLSRTRRASPPPRSRPSAAVAAAPPRLRRPSVLAVSAATSQSAGTAARSTNRTMPGGRAIRRTTSAANRLFPTPPGPIRVRSLVRPNALPTAPISLSRPMSGVTSEVARAPKPSRRAGWTASSGPLTFVRPVTGGVGLRSPGPAAVAAAPVAPATGGCRRRCRGRR